MTTASFLGTSEQIPSVSLYCAYRGSVLAQKRGNLARPRVLLTILIYPPQKINSTTVLLAMLR